MTSAFHLQDYFFHGRRLRSPFPLPSLPLWPALDTEGRPDITLCFGETPASLANPLWSSPFVQIGRDKGALVNIAAVGRFWLPDNGPVTIQPSQGSEPFEIETILLGTVAGILLHQRSMLPLHASCVVLDGSAIAIGGSSASGKSALAAALVRRGALLLTDDLCVLGASKHSVHAVAGTMHARLWPDVMDRLEIPSELRLPTRPVHPKHAVVLPAAEARAWPLQLLVRLGSSNLASEPVLERQQDLASLFPPDTLVYQRKIGQLFGNAATELCGLTALARHVSRYSLRTTKALGHLEQCADLILNALRGEA
jgi:hypothetical protein